MANEKKGRKKAPPGTTRVSTLLSEESIDMLRALCVPRGGYSRAKGPVIEEAIHRMHAQDTLIKRPKRKDES